MFTKISMSQPIHSEYHPDKSLNSNYLSVTKKQKSNISDRGIAFQSMLQVFPSSSQGAHNIEDGTFLRQNTNTIEKVQQCGGRQKTIWFYILMSKRNY